LGRILKEPDAPWVAFLKGVGGAAGVMGAPVLVHLLVASRGGSDGFSIQFWVNGAIIGGVCLLAGIWCAIRAAVKRQAYDRVSRHPFH
jgi:hypothetical protein